MSIIYYNSFSIIPLLCGTDGFSERVLNCFLFLILISEVYLLFQVNQTGIALINQLMSKSDRYILQRLIPLEPTDMQAIRQSI